MSDSADLERAAREGLMRWLRGEVPAKEANQVRDDVRAWWGTGGGREDVDRAIATLASVFVARAERLKLASGVRAGDRCAWCLLEVEEGDDLRFGRAGFAVVICGNCRARQTDAGP